jgi:hypothetical protein
MVDVPANCKRCGRRIDVDPALSADVFEGMHWLCFHLEFEHSTDPDVACGDYTSCPWWIIRHYKDRLRQLGVDPDEVLQTAINAIAKETEV